MSDVARIDPMLARHGLRAPAELDGFAVKYCKGISYHGEQPGLSNGHWVDADFAVEGLDRPLTATTTDGGRTWKTVVSNG